MAGLSSYFEDSNPEEFARQSFSEMARTMTSSRILVIAYAVRAAIEAGAEVANFTVGDFSPDQFQIPQALKTAIAEAIARNETNYPPAHGTAELRSALQAHYKAEMKLDYPEDAFVVASGARPVLYAAYRCLIDPGELVVTPAPSWNNNNFCHLVGAEHVTVPTRAEDGFMPTAETLGPHLKRARLLVLCSPMNPAGTMITQTQMSDICDLVLAENTRRRASGERLLYVMYDQVYRMLAFDGREHVTPVGVYPEMAKYTLFTDAISKCFGATGLRVGWIVAPPQVAARVKALMTHMGAWAPRPEQIGTAEFLSNVALVDDFLTQFRSEIKARLERLSKAFADWKAEGLPIEVIPPQGAIYLSVRFDLEGRAGLQTEDDVRRYLLEEAGCALVPFSAFGDRTNQGWFRFSVGAVGLEEIDRCLPRLKRALESAISQ